MWPTPAFRPSDPGDSLVWLRPCFGVATPACGGAALVMRATMLHTHVRASGCVDRHRGLAMMWAIGRRGVGAAVVPRAGWVLACGRQSRRWRLAHRRRCLLLIRSWMQLCDVWRRRGGTAKGGPGLASDTKVAWLASARVLHRRHGAVDGNAVPSLRRRPCEDGSSGDVRTS